MYRKHGTTSGTDYTASFPANLIGNYTKCTINTNDSTAFNFNSTHTSGSFALTSASTLVVKGSSPSSEGFTANWKCTLTR